MKVVLDTNVLVSGIFWKGVSRAVLELWAKETFEVVLSPLILEEYERLLAEMERKRATGLADAWMRFIVKHSVMIYPEGEFRLCRDPDDDKFLHCAVSAGARVLVSSDNDLLVLKRVAGVDILTPRKLLQIFHKKD